MATFDRRSADQGLEDLLRRIQPRARSIFARYRVPPSDAEDLLQEALLVFVHKREGIHHPEGWLIGTLRNRCLAYWRARRRVVYQAVDTAILELVARPERPMQERRDLNSDLKCAIGTLPSRCRSLLKLRYQMGCTPHEAAERLGYRRSSIYKIMERCLAALTSRLVDRGLVREKSHA